MVKKLPAKEFGEITHDYIEDEALGAHFSCSQFDKSTSNVYLMSDKSVISYDVRTGKRKRIFSHEAELIGMTLCNEILVTYTINAQQQLKVLIWRLQDAEQLFATEVKLPNDQKPLWHYAIPNKQYVLAVDHAENSSLFQIVFERIDLDNFIGGKFIGKGRSIHAKFLAKVGKRPDHRKCLAIDKRFFVKCEQKEVNLIHVEEGVQQSESEDNSDGDEHELAHQHGMRTKFKLNVLFDLADQTLAAFDAVYVVGDTLFATVNVGRIYAWHNFKEEGISDGNMSHITLTGHKLMLCCSERGTMFVATGKGLLYKYNMSGSSGVGRWHRLEFMQLAAPPRTMAISEDSTLLNVILTDNTAMIVNTVAMVSEAKAEVLNTTQLGNSWTHRFLLANDPLNPGMIVMNARHGHIQWADPFRWKTTQLFDVAEENVPHEETFNRPDVLCLDTYLIEVSVPRVATCECRKDKPNKSYLKFWLRNKHADEPPMELENCFILAERIVFIRSNLEESPDEAKTSADKQEFLCVSASGKMDVYMRDLERNGLWRRDLGRHEMNWQHSQINSCSRIQANEFATVNALSDSTYVIVWDFSQMRIVQIIDTLRNANQVEWSPDPDVMLICTQSGLVAFNRSANSFVWAILQPGLSLYSNRITTFAHNHQEVFILDPQDGTIGKEPVKFGQPQKCIVAVQNDQGQLGFCGMDHQGSISMIRPKENEKQMDQNGDESCDRRETAFSRLEKTVKKRALNAEDNTKQQRRRPLMSNVSVRKIIDGPAHSLPPIMELAEQFVDSCLRKRPRVD